MSELQVDPMQLRETARFIIDRAQIIGDGVGNLNNTVGRELLSDGWQGSAASAYDESWVEWKQAAEEVVAALRDSAMKLYAAADEYERRDIVNRAAIDRAGEQV